MPYKCPIQRREYARLRRQKIRNEFFKNKKCVKCNATDNLELDHINPEEKEHHEIWCWAKERREKELTKCQVLCNECHKEKSKREQHVLTDKQVIHIRQSKKSTRKLAKEFNVSHMTVYDAKRRKSYTHLV